MSKNLIVSVKNRVLSLTINRPELKNALNRELYASLAEQLERSDQDEQIRAVLLKANGDTFTAGNDLDDFLHPIEESGTPSVIRFF
ncbi:enoyl-CoA hydratase-related protein [Paraglaciecola chathamensis]|uniref:enoyl-CoA hydratase-related protein n=1 Tax=Paraglaciecola chathamensis TaxID=368405 RepID=UPI0022B841B2|nr:enoyl-CoA hydratase-related protein [Paraglaciecola chathamensis]